MTVGASGTRAGGDDGAELEAGAALWYPAELHQLARAGGLGNGLSTVDGRVAMMTR